MRIARPKIHAAAEHGFTMIVTLIVLLISSLLMAAAFAAATGDVHLTRNDTYAKKAYYAAQAGVSNYAFHLNADFNYWTYCKAAGNEALNLYGETPLKTRAVPGSTDEKYAIQLLPATTAPENDKKCDVNNPVATMIESGTANTGTFRIESTGYSGHEKRTILATFAHTSFLNYLYYTQYETLDPVTYSPARYQCEAYRGVRPEPPECENIQFVSADVVNGPLHTEDEASICGEPTFGRNSGDRIEFKRGTVSAGSGCPNAPHYLGTLIPPAEVPSFEPPPSNTSLKNTPGAFKYEGKTLITLEGATMKVTNNKGETKSVGLPPSGAVVYVSNGLSPTCSKAYTPYNPSYTTDTACGNVYVSGKYTVPLTIGAENDIVIKGSLVPPLENGAPSTNAVLGLIANNFVRIYHPVSSGSGINNSSSECNATNLTESNDPNKWGSLTNPEIYAAILAVNHSFIVDNFRCGSPLGSLNLHGAIAQIFRGTVGTHNGSSIASGYSKGYVYDNRLEVESPPYFLNPVHASWFAKREVLAPNP
jgi:Tfp pilus assembly protein PilE